MTNIKGLKEKLGDARKRKANIKNDRNKLFKQLDQLDIGSTNWDAKDQREFDKIKNKIESLSSDFKDADRDVDKYTSQLMNMGEDPYWHTSTDGPGMNGFDGSSGNQDIEEWKSVAGENKGKTVKVLGPRTSLASQHQNFEGQDDMAEYLRGRVRGFTQNGSFANDAMSTSVDSAIVPQPLADQIIDSARNKSRVISAGARTVEMDSKTLTIARVKDSTSVTWKKENQPHNAGTMAFEPLTFTAHTIIGTCVSSVELAEDAGNLAQVVKEDLASQIALELDRAAMLGSGTDPEPTGIVNTTNVQEKSLGSGDGAALTDYSEFSLGVQQILAANGAPNAVIYSPRTWGELDRLTASDGQPLMAPQSYQDLQKFQTKQIPDDLTFGTSDDASLAIIGDWSQCMIGIRTSLRLEVTRAGSMDDTSAFENLQILWRAYARYDIQLSHPSHFYVVNAITPAS